MFTLYDYQTKKTFGEFKTENEARGYLRERQRQALRDKELINWLIYPIKK